MDTEVFDIFGESFFCSICQEDIQEGQRTLVISRCQHGFHEPCVSSWLHSKGTCPNCRSELPSQTIEERPRLTQLDLDRSYIAYILTDWLLRLFRKRANLFIQNHREIRNLVVGFEWQGIRTIPIDISSLSAIGRIKSYIIRREQIVFDEVYPNRHHTVIHRCPRLLQIRQEIQPRLSQFVADRHL